MKQWTNILLDQLFIYKKTALVLTGRLLVILVQIILQNLQEF